MLLKDTRRAFGLVSIMFHWTVAMGFLGLFGLGWYMLTLDYYDPMYTTLPFWHKSLGVLMCVLVLMQISWRLIVARPAPIETLARWEIVASRLVHGVLLLGMLVVLASGYLIPTADGEGIEVFSWFVAPAVELPLENQEDLSGEIHWIAAILVLSVAAVHALAALKHHFLNHDGTLRRMLVPKESDSSQ